MRAWRLVRAEFASVAFTGAGAEEWGGRWNDPGDAVVYCSEHLSLAALEILANANRSELRGRYAAIEAIIPDDLLLESADYGLLPTGWNRPLISEPSRSIGRRWLQDRRAVGLVVPSAVMPQERNVLLNPRHPDFTRLEMMTPIPFAFDPRLV